MTSRKADACTLPALLMPMHWNMPESELMRPRIFRLWLWEKGGVSKSPTDSFRQFDVDLPVRDLHIIVRRD